MGKANGNKYRSPSQFLLQKNIGNLKRQLMTSNEVMGLALILLPSTKRRVTIQSYIKRFNEMEEFIKYLLEARTEFPLLTDNIMLIHETPKP